MKKIAFILSLSVICSFSMAQKVVYDGSGHRTTYMSEDLDIKFSKSAIKLAEPEGEQLAPLLLAAVPTLLDFGFKFTGKQLEKSVKKWAAEYVKQKTYMQAGARDLAPNFQLIRRIQENGSPSDIEVFSINFKAVPVPGVSGFVYGVDDINLVKSSAKSSSRFNTFDYSIELKISYLKDGKTTIQELAPLIISSVNYGKTSFPSEKHITGLVPLPAGGVITEICVKVTESNPAKLRAERLLAFWNDNKEGARTIVNNFLPEEKDSEPKPEAADSNAGVTSVPTKKTKKP